MHMCLIYLCSRIQRGLKKRLLLWLGLDNRAVISHPVAGHPTICIDQSFRRRNLVIVLKITGTFSSAKRKKGGVYKCKQTSVKTLQRNFNNSHKLQKRKWLKSTFLNRQDFVAG